MGLFYAPITDEVSTDAPYRRTVGHEFEYASGTDLAQVLADNGHAPPGGRLHGYGCNCEESDDFAVHPTSDCTAAGGEYLIGGNHGVLFGSPQYYLATKALADAAMVVRPTVDTRVGGHTHVGSDDLNEPEKWRLVRNYIAVQDELSVIMAAGLATARSNGHAEPKLSERYFDNGVDGFWTLPADQLSERMRHLGRYLPSRPTLCFGTSTGHTVEFRGWNSTRAQWRMIVAANVSSGMVEAAKRGVEADKGTDLVRHLSGLLKYDVIALIQRQRKAKGL